MKPCRFKHRLQQRRMVSKLPGRAVAGVCADLAVAAATVTGLLRTAGTASGLRRTLFACGVQKAR